MTNKRLTIWLLGVIVLLIIIAILGSTGGFSLLKKLFQTKGAPQPPREPDAHLTTSRDAYDVAFARAKEWQPDAVLAFLSSSDAGETGRAQTWKFIFVSRVLKGKGFSVEVAKGAVAAATEIPYTNVGAELPPDIISPEEAIKQVRQLKGYTAEEILGIEAVYGPGEKLWYWGVKTKRGIVSVEARKK